MDLTAFACPRRREVGQPLEPKEDVWQYRDGRHSCSWCGSLHPDELFTLLEAGSELIPTDKNYKVYVRPFPGGQIKAYFQHFNEAHMTRFIELINGRTVKIAWPGHLYTLPFFAQPL